MQSRLLFLAMLAVTTLVACDADGGDTTPADTTAVDSAAVQPQLGAPADSIIPMSEAIIMDSIPVRTPEGTPARFGHKSGRIVLRYTGNMVGTRVVMFDDWGLRESRLDSSVPNGAAGPPQYALLLSSPERFAMIDMAQKQGWTMPNGSDDRYLQSDSGKKYALGEILFRHSGGVRLPDEVVKGYTTKVQELNQGALVTRVWVWQGIILREQFRSPTMNFTCEVESIELDIDIPASTFEVPAGVKLEERKPQAAPPGAPPPGPKGEVIMPPPPRPGGGSGTMPSPAPVPIPMPGGR